MAAEVFALLREGTWSLAMGMVSAQEPDQLPEVKGDEVPEWMQPFSVFAGLPVWVQAALVAAVAAGILMIVLTIGKGVWRAIARRRLDREHV